MGKDDDTAAYLGAVVTVIIEDREVDADNGIQARVHAGLEVLDCPVEPVAVSAGKGSGSIGCCGLGEFLRPGNAIVRTKGSGYVQMGESHVQCSLWCV
jgi:hypothetical protein